MLPLPIHQYGEQVAVQVVHRVVFFADARGLFRVAGLQHFLRAVTQFHGHSAHLGEVPVDFFG